MIDEDYLILVHEDDQPWGKLGKSLVHQLGLLHRAFSVFIFNSDGKLLLQQRADDKYHSGGLWTNTCCSHPRFGEELNTSIDRRLMEEMGIKCKTNFEFSFIYKAEFENGLKEYEYDHVYFGLCDDVPTPNKTEVKNWRYVDINWLAEDIKTHPAKYSAWLKICFETILFHYSQFIKKNKLITSSDVSL
jgi:isopentenyl-diphosphate delta-isomerase